LYKDGSLEKIDLPGRSVYRRLPVALSGGGGWSDSYGGVVSTVSDFYLLTNWLLNHNNLGHIGVLNFNSLKMMISNQIGELFAGSSSSYKYGLGVGVTEGSDGETKEIFWAGSPYNTYFWINYEKKEVGILFTNTAPYRHLDMMNKFKEMVNGI
jgi:CubicO group peptidase (beta-lactamase class C family)